MLLARQSSRAQLNFASRIWPDRSAAKAGLQKRREMSCSSWPSGAGNSAILVGDHVRMALANGVPVVALESTVVTHGLPEPQNFELALSLEREICSGAWWSCSSPSSSPFSPERPRMAGQVIAATVGIVRGQLIVGLSHEQLEYLARVRESRPIKCSRRDIPLARALCLNAGTTVSGTLAIVSALGPMSARANSLRVFATGGLGGVHRDGHNSMDVSADLHELGRSGDGSTARALGVVSSGFKSFLDTRRSLELLETLGVTVASLAQTHHLYRADSVAQGAQDCVAPAERRAHNFPGFFTSANKEQVKSPWQCASVPEAARVLAHCLAPRANLADEMSRRQRQQQLDENTPSSQRCMLLACPIPREFSLDSDRGNSNNNSDGANTKQDSAEQKSAHLDDYERALRSISESIDTRLDLNGYEKTPLILSELNRLTGGKTLQANLQLLKNNARIGAHLAYELALLMDPRRCAPPSRCAPQLAGLQRSRNPPVVIGCTMIDMHVKTKIDRDFRSNPKHSGITFAGEPHLSLGGVGRNLATALELLGHEPVFVTSLADDNLGEFARAEMAKNFAINPQGPKVLAWRASSSCFALVLIDSLTGLCEYVVANLQAAHAISGRALGELEGGAVERQLAEAPLLVMDANVPGETVRHLIEFCRTHQVPVFIEPTDVNCLPDLVAALKQSAQPGSSSLKPDGDSPLAFISPNAIELGVMLQLFSSEQQIARLETPENVELAARRLIDEHLPQLKCIIVTMDKHGVLVGLRLPAGSPSDIGTVNLGEFVARGGNVAPGSQLVFKHFEPTQLVESPISASGAGDCFAAGFVSAFLDNRNLNDCVRRGFKTSILALGAMDTVPKELSELASKERQNKHFSESR